MLVIEWGLPIWWTPRFERIGALRWRVAWLLFSVSYVETRSLNAFIEDVSEIVSRKTSGIQ